MDFNYFDQLFPFSFAFNDELKITYLGKQLKKICPEIQLGHLVEEYFESLPSLQPQIRVELKHKKNGLCLRGEFVTTEGHTILIGGVWPPNERVEHVLKEEERLALAFLESRDAVWEWNVQTDDWYFSPTWYEMLGYKDNEIPSTLATLEEVIKEEDLIQIEGLIQNHFKHKTPFQMKARMRTKGGKWKWILMRGRVVEWRKDGAPLIMLGTNTDVDKEKAIEEKLHLLHGRLMDGIEILESGFAIFDKEEKLALANSRFGELFSLPSSCLTQGVSIGKILREIDPSDAFVARELAHFRDPGKIREDIFGSRWLRHSERRTSEGGVVSLVTDISNIKQAEYELKMAREKEMEIGYRIQKTLLFGHLNIKPQGFDIYPLTMPSQGVDGDFYDFFVLGKEGFDLVIGDVMGKGIPAALLGAATKSSFSRALTYLSGSKKPKPDQIVTFVHNEVTSGMIDLETFMTICYARFDLLSKSLILVDAGHTTTLQLKAAIDHVKEISGDNVPLGFLEDEIYSEIEIPYESGDIFLFYSDGVTECRSEKGELFGIERLKNILLRNKSKSAEEMGQVIIQEVERFTKLGRLQDDLTLIVVKVDLTQVNVVEQRVISVPADLKELHSIRSFVRDFCHQIPEPLWGESKTFHLELATDEAVTNIIEHALEDLKGATIELTIERFNDRLLLHLDYKGRPFQPEKVTRPQIEQLQEGGFGLYIIEKITEGIEYKEKKPGMQRITITKNL